MACSAPLGVSTRLRVHARCSCSLLRFSHLIEKKRGERKSACMYTESIVSFGALVPAQFDRVLLVFLLQSHPRKPVEIPNVQPASGEKKHSLPTLDSLDDGLLNSFRPGSQAKQNSVSPMGSKLIKTQESSFHVQTRQKQAKTGR